MSALDGGCSGSGRRCFGCAGRCNATPRIDAGRIGPPTASVTPIRKRCGSGWGCPARVSRPRPNAISRPAGGCVITSPKRLACMWPTRCGRRSTGTCSPTPPGGGTGRRGSVRGGSSPASPGGPAHTPKPPRYGRPTAWSAPSTGTWTLTATGSWLKRCLSPRRPPPRRRADHDGALAVVFTGLPAGDLVMPVRLPQGAGQWAHLTHFLADPNIWHKIDLVRVADRRAPGGWRYYAHLLTHHGGYQASSTRDRRAAVPTDRRAGADANVSNLSVASFPAQHPEQLAAGRIDATPEQLAAAAREAKRARDRQRALDRSRRNTNPDQYGPSVRQQERAQRRAEKGLTARRVTDPGGPRAARVDGVPLRAYRHDQLSGRYRTIRADHAEAARGASQAKHARAAQVAAMIVAWHGNTITVEDCRISTWARLWGKRIAVFSPGMLVWALEAECVATGGQFYRAGTRSTALSQHCLCGQRVAKTLDERTHDCGHCGLRGDRDIVSAMLAACVDLTDPQDPRTARVDYKLAHALRTWLAPQQEWEGSVNRHQPPAPPGAEPARTGSHHPVAPAEHAALGPPPNRPDPKSGRRGTSRKDSPQSCLALHDPVTGQLLVVVAPSGLSGSVP